MAFKYNPPTRSLCCICERLSTEICSDPIITSNNGKASSANNFPFHNWYNFVLGYSPEFPEYMLNREAIKGDDLVVDPFVGSGTTLVSCKMKGIPAKGIDANDFIIDAAKVKLNWDIDINILKEYRTAIIAGIEQKFSQYKWNSEKILQVVQPSLYGEVNEDLLDYTDLVSERRTKELTSRYISDKPFAKVCLINDVISNCLEKGPYRDIFDLALTSILVPVSNVYYGPGFGVGKAKDDADVLGLFKTKVDRMINDLSLVDVKFKKVKSEVRLGDSRKLGEYLEPESVSLMITSPPYPGDHEYTKHTRLELLFREYATGVEEFRIIKKRMLRASTTNMYKDDNDRENVNDLLSIQKITELIQERLDHDGATSGFEKLYAKLVWEYFGGMYNVLQQCFYILKPGGKIALLVSDSHAFKMVHIQTAEILREIGEKIGYKNNEIILWQSKRSTSHKYILRENILILGKP